MIKTSYFPSEMNTSVVKVDAEAFFQLEAASNTSDGLWPANATEDFEDGVPSSIYDILIPILYCLVCVVGLVGNSLVIFTIIQQVKMRTVTNIYIFNLAMADGLFMLGLPFLALQIALHRWPFGGLMCRLVMILDGINQFTSVFCITVMSIDRYLAVAHPIRSSKWRSPSLAKKVSVILWMISFIPVIPMAIYSDVDGTTDICTLIWPEPMFVWTTAFIVYTFVLGFALPFTIISFCYILLLMRIKTALISSHSTESDNSEKKITSMVVAIVVAFVICWLPFYIINICFAFFPIPDTFSMRRIFEFMVALSYFNSCANPILYICLSESFWRSFQMMLCPKFVLRKKVPFGKGREDHQMQDLTESHVTLSGGEVESVLDILPSADRPSSKQFLETREI
ncbi:somatostatin receptor type 5-like [Heptranchias perlo]|uniref:somatostatin receptor type 5-like n=1 Tax=Heptranchias perlo TaxID=212740 RepID=UPI0035594657